MLSDTLQGFQSNDTCSALAADAFAMVPSVDDTGRYLRSALSLIPQVALVH